MNNFYFWILSSSYINSKVISELQNRGDGATVPSKLDSVNWNSSFSDFAQTLRSPISLTFEFWSLILKEKSKFFWSWTSLVKGVCRVVMRFLGENRSQRNGYRRYCSLSGSSVLPACRRCHSCVLPSAALLHTARALEDAFGHAWRSHNKFPSWTRWPHPPYCTLALLLLSSSFGYHSRSIVGHRWNSTWPTHHHPIAFAASFASSLRSACTRSCCLSSSESVRGPFLPPRRSSAPPRKTSPWTGHHGASLSILLLVPCSHPLLVLTDLPVPLLLQPNRRHFGRDGERFEDPSIS